MNLPMEAHACRGHKKQKKCRVVAGNDPTEVPHKPGFVYAVIYLGVLSPILSSGFGRIEQRAAVIQLYTLSLHLQRGLPSFCVTAKSGELLPHRCTLTKSVEYRFWSAELIYSAFHILHSTFP